MKSLIEATQKTEDFPATIELVISNKKDAKGLEFASKSGIKNIVINHKNYPSREEFDQEIAKKIEENNCEIICLAGFMRILSSWFIEKFSGKIINIHPSLLPSFKGAKAISDALKYGVKISGCTTHIVTSEMDSGPIILQESVKICENDNESSLAARILEKEHLIYPKTLEIFAKKLLKNK